MHRGMLKFAVRAAAAEQRHVRRLGMFDKVDDQISVAVEETVKFRFATDLSPTSFIVADVSREEIVWEVVHGRFGGEGSVSGTFQSWPADEAPPQIVALLDQLSDRERRRLEAEGPRFPLLREIVYGELPSGYRSDTGPAPLRPGSYRFTLFAEQGIASVPFEVLGA